MATAGIGAGSAGVFVPIQRLQAERDAQAAAARAEQLQRQSNDARRDADRLEQRSVQLNAAAQGERAQESLARQRIERTPATQSVGQTQGNTLDPGQVLDRAVNQRAAAAGAVPAAPTSPLVQSLNLYTTVAGSTRPDPVTVTAINTTA